MIESLLAFFKSLPLKHCYDRKSDNCVKASSDSEGQFSFRVTMDGRGGGGGKFYA